MKVWLVILFMGLNDQPVTQEGYLPRSCETLKICQERKTFFKKYKKQPATQPAIAPTHSINCVFAKSPRKAVLIAAEPRAKG